MLDPSVHPTPFAELAQRPCPPAVELLLAAQRELDAAPVAARRADELLDSDARALFGIAAMDDTRQQAEWLADVLEHEHAWIACDDGDPCGLLVDRALEERRAHPLIVATVGAEIARRAGAQAKVFASGHRWLVGVGPDRTAADRRRIVLVDATLSLGRTSAPHQIRALCSHEVTYCALTGLSARLDAAGRRDLALTASRLRLALPIDDGRRERVREELDAYEG